MKSIPTKVVPQPVVVQEIGGDRTWEQATLEEWDNEWTETTPGASRAQRWCRIDGEMVRFEDAG